MPSPLPHLRRMASHARWADEALIDRLRQAPEPQALKYMAHVIAAGRVWLTRLDGRSSAGMEIWPEWTIEETATHAATVHPDLERYLADVQEDALDEPIVYRNQTGKEFSTSRIDVLTHLMMHGGYHRGQIARALRQAGYEPINTDFITWVRTRGE